MPKTFSMPALVAGLALALGLALVAAPAAALNASGPRIRPA